MNKENKELLQEVIKDRLSKSLGNDEESKKAFSEAMTAVDKQIQIDKQKKDVAVKCVEISATLLLSPLIESRCKKAFAKLICNFEKDYTFTTTAGRSLSSIFRFK